MAVSDSLSAPCVLTSLEITLFCTTWLVGRGRVRGRGRGVRGRVGVAGI